MSPWRKITRCCFCPVCCGSSPAIFDRCDGEIARVRLCETKFGAWFDTVTDNIAYIAAYAGLLIGVQRLYPDHHYYMGLGVSAVIALFLYLGLAYRYALKRAPGVCSIT